MDLALLQLMATKENYVRFKPYVKDYVLSKESKNVYHSLENYYKQHAHATSIDWHALEAWFFISKAATLRKQDAELYKKLFGNLATHVSTETADEVMSYYITQDYATQIGKKTMEVMTGDAEIDDIGELVSMHDKELGRAISLDDLFVSTDVSSVLDSVTRPGIDWRLGELNISCGPLRGGDFVLVAAYVGVGKTSFVADQVSHLATQLPAGKQVVWVNNEERSDKVQLRIMQAALGKTIEEINKDRVVCDAAYLALMGGDSGKIRVLKNDGTINNVSKLTSIFSDMKPGLIVFDQLDKVNGLRQKDEGEHMRLGSIYKWARDLAHEYSCPVIAVTQADASGATTKYIGQEQLRGSKVDKPAEADLIITIGMDLAVSRLTRYIHIPKNKQTGGPLFKEDERNGKWEVNLNGPISRYEGTH